jgi:putative membrane protein
LVGFIIRAVISAAGLWLASRIVPGVEVTDLKNLLEAAVLLGLVNAVVRPILVVLTLPVTVLTLGIFLLIINAGLILLVSHFIHGFILHGWGAAIVTAIVTGVVSWIGAGLTSGGEDRRG